MPSKYDYDLIVIGAGSAGLTAAEFAVRLGAKTALIEKHRVGGDCTWTGCVPSKALIQAASIAHSARTADHYGIITGQPQVDMGGVRDYVQGVVQAVYAAETPAVLAQKNIDVVMGAAHFLDSHRVQVGQRTLSARHFILATGAHPFIPPIDGLADVPFVTYEQLFENDRLPNHLLITGAGAIGAEMAQAYARLGAQVTLIDIALLPEEEQAARDVIARVFRQEGIGFVEGLATSARQDGDTIILTLQGSEEVLRGDMLLVAAGRRPNVHGIALENAGVGFDMHGIQVDKFLRTAVPHIYAVGDVLGGPQFTHYAGWQAFQAVRNALLPGNAAGHTNMIPRAIFTDPGVAHMGLTERQARDQFGDGIHVFHATLDTIDRAMTDNDRDGFIKIIHKGERILGATIVAHHAGEMINEISLAMTNNLQARNIASAMHVYPTYSLGVQMSAAEITSDTLLSGVLGTTIKKIAATG